MIQIFNYENSPIQFEVIGGQVMANATTMCKAFSKNPTHWMQTKSASKYMDALSKKVELTGIPLVETREGANGGTWIHEKLILNLARWLDTDFEIWCDEKISELLRAGTVSIRPKSAAELLLENALVTVEHERRLNSLESKVDLLIEARAEATRQLEALPLSTESVPVESERTQVVRLVNSYCEQTGISQHDTWNKLYGDLYYKYHISIKAYKKLRGEKTYLDVAERLGHCGKLKALVSAMINDLRRIAS